ncbi:MAG: hypothetical protein M1833_003443 [Piccolia ochrophora]|nr:MAG: hypothetical protein M1833_003443 [Piccolia ochrophora]
MDPVICKLITGILDRPWLASLQILGPGSRQIYCSLGNPSKKKLPDKTLGLQVQVWSSDAEGSFYVGSHTQTLDPVGAENGWLEIPKENLEMLNIDPLTLSLDQGAL